MSRSSRLAAQQRRYRSQDLYGQRWSNMSVGDLLSRKIARGTQVPNAQAAPRAVPAGWYPCWGDPVGSVRWWDGQQWTPGFKP